MSPLSPVLTASWLNCGAQTALSAPVMAGLKLSGVILLIPGAVSVRGSAMFRIIHRCCVFKENEPGLFICCVKKTEENEAALH